MYLKAPSLPLTDKAPGAEQAMNKHLKLTWIAALSDQYQHLTVAYLYHPLPFKVGISCIFEQRRSVRREEWSFTPSQG